MENKKEDTKSITEDVVVHKEHFSKNIGQLALALSKAQGEFSAAIKDKKNPFFKSNFADLSSVIEASRDALVRNEIAVMQFPSGNEMRTYLTTKIVHSSGEWLESTIACVPQKQDIQSIGGTLTYLRRYSLASILGITQEDDDGNGNSYITNEQLQTIETLINGYEGIRARMIAKYKLLKKIPLLDYGNTIKVINRHIADAEKEKKEKEKNSVG